MRPSTPRVAASCYPLLLAWILVAVPAFGSTAFLEVAASKGIGPYAMAPGMGGGIAAADFDDDGDIDFFLPTADGTPHLLYRNLGDGTFEEIAAAAGLASMERGRVALWVDYDGDHHLDLLIAGDCFELTCTPGTSLLRLYQQLPGPVFADVTVARWHLR